MGYSDVAYDVFDPACVIITGFASSLQSTEQRRTFELFRRQISGVQVVTFDESFARIEGLIDVLESQ
jgi:hypothetical protein